MGCFNSRFDRRNANSGDFNTVAAAFLGGKDGELFDGFPVDRVLAALDTAKEPAGLVEVGDDLKLTNETQTVEIYKEALNFLKEHHKTLTDQLSSKADNKEFFYQDKYPAKEVLDGIQNTINDLKEKSKIADEEPAADPKAEAPKEEMAAAEGEMMNEGGDEMMMEEKAEDMGMTGMEGSMAPENPFKYDSDSRSYDGWNDVAAILLRNMLVNPVFGDLVKANALSWEYNQSKTKAYPQLSRAAALVSAAAQKAATGENNLFISGYIDNDAFEAIQDLVKEKKNIHFPFVTAGWGDRANALAAFHHIPISDKKKAEYKKVLFEVTGAPSFEFAGCRQVTSRLNGAISEGKEEDGVHVFPVAAKALAAQTVEEWKKAREAPAAEATPAAAAAPADGEVAAAPEGEMMAAPEGEMMAAAE